MVLLSTQPSPPHLLNAHASGSKSSSGVPAAPTPPAVAASPSPGASGGRAKKYICHFDGCGKGYTRPTRLEEHIRSHTGERPFACGECDATFGRDSHLKAHVRTHAGDEEKRYACTECDKKFWTNQHLKKHGEVVHRGKTYDCPTCGQPFRKHNLLRTHTVEVHSPPGTLPFPCTDSNCDRSFSQLVHLKAHLKTHDLTRYQCGHPDCLLLPLTARQFATWSALQKHSKAAHPPVCPHPECNKKTFTTPRGLRNHLEGIHGVKAEGAGGAVGKKRKREMTRKKDRRAKRDAEEAEETHSDHDDDAERSEEEREERLDEYQKQMSALGRKKRRSSSRESDEVDDTPWICEQCSKKYKSRLQAAALESHVLSKHGEAPPIKRRRPTPAASIPKPQSSVLDLLTGHNYAASGQSNGTSGNKSKRRYRCPFPAILSIGTLLDSDDERGSDVGENDAEERFEKGLDGEEGACTWWFGRVYDVERHLRARHGVEVHRAELAEWLAEESDDE